MPCAARAAPPWAAALGALGANPTLPLAQALRSKPGEESTKLRVLSFSKPLGEYVGQLVVGANILQFYISVLYLFSEPVVLDVEMLGSFSETRVSRYFYTRL